MALIALTFVGSVSAQPKADQPGRFKPSAPVNSNVKYLEDYCNYMEMTITISTYVSGYQLNLQGFTDLARSIRKEEYDGPRLDLAGIEKTKGQFCSGKDDAPPIIPPRTTGIIAYGSEKYWYGTYDSITKIRYKVLKQNGAGAEFVSTGCELTLAAKSETGPNERFNSIDLIPNAECANLPNLKIASADGWCEGGYYSRCRATSRYANAYMGVTVSGRDFFVYWDDKKSKQEPSSLNDTSFGAILQGPTAAPSEGSADDAAPSSSPSPSSAPTSAAFKSHADQGLLMLFILPLLFFFNTGFDRRGVLACLLLCFVLSNSVAAQAEPVKSNSTQNTTLVARGVSGNSFSPPDRIDFLKFLVDTAVSYILTWGRCKSFISETIILTGIKGDLLDYSFYPTPVGMNRYAGPKLELIPSRTKYHYGNQCNDEDAVPAVIPANSAGSIFVGDSYYGLASSEVDMYYKVFKPDGSPSNCVIKIYINDVASTKSNLERKPILQITKEQACGSEIPNLEINYLGEYCGKKGLEKGYCYARPATSGQLAQWGYAANVYFRGVPLPATASSFNDTGFSDSYDESDSKTVVDGAAAEAPSTTEAPSTASSATKPIISYILFSVIAIFY